MATPPDNICCLVPRFHSGKRDGTTTLFAALDIATGKVNGNLKTRNRASEFFAFLKHIDRQYPQQDLHLVVDNYATHKTAKVKQWLAAHPRIHMPFSPTSASWMNMVEFFFGIVDRQAIRRGIFGSVRELNARNRGFIEGWNKRKHPFVWTKPADEILARAKR